MYYAYNSVYDLRYPQQAWSQAWELNGIPTTIHDKCILELAYVFSKL